ncbi:MAG: hypothetical protein ACPGQD_05605 [Planctomycetota bacterium]
MADQNGLRFERKTLILTTRTKQRLIAECDTATIAGVCRTAIGSMWLLHESLDDGIGTLKTGDPDTVMSAVNELEKRALAGERSAMRLRLEGGLFAIAAAALVAMAVLS